MPVKSIPVVMYHHVVPGSRELNVTPELFEDQISLLVKKGWKTLSGREFLEFLHAGTIPGKCVLLTFDDGFADNYIYAWPILKKYGARAMMFAATDFVKDADINRSSFVPMAHKEAWAIAKTDNSADVICTWNELKEMDEDGAFDIQSHGMSHKTPEYMRDKDLAALKNDLSQGKAILEQRLSKEITHFAWPSGDYTDEGIAAAAEAGYKALYTTERGSNNSGNLLSLKRLPVKCKNGRWLVNKLCIYSSPLLSRLYLAVRSGI